MKRLYTANVLRIESAGLGPFAPTLADFLLEGSPLSKSGQETTIYQSPVLPCTSPSLFLSLLTQASKVNSETNPLYSRLS
jgi:hypothetical protein